MKFLNAWISDLRAAAGKLWDGFVAYLPELIGALLILLAGWIVAKLIRRATIRLANGLNVVLRRYNRFLEGFTPTGRDFTLTLSPRATELVANIAYWLVLLLFIVAATRTARLYVFANWFDQVIAYLPNLLAGLFIIIAGYVVSALARDLTAAATPTFGENESRILAKVAQSVIIVTAAIIGFDQIGVDVTFLVTLLSVVIGAAFLGLAIAFGFGARTLVSNLIGAHYLQRQFRQGQTVRLGELEGEILEFTPTTVVLATEHGRTMVPAKTINETAATLVIPHQDDDRTRKADD